jgi:hypothetical protein
VLALLLLPQARAFAAEETFSDLRRLQALWLFEQQRLRQRTTLLK